MKTVLTAEFSDYRFDARVRKQIDALATREYHVTACMFDTSREKNHTIRKKNTTFHIYGYESRYRNSGRFDTVRKYLRALVILNAVCLRILRTRADVYHVHNLKFFFAFLLASLVYRGKLVYDAHEIHSEHYDNSSWKGRLKNRINYAIERLILKRCDAFIQASDERADFVSRKFKIPRPWVIRNHVPRRTRDPNNRLLRDQLNIPGNHAIVFYSGGIYLGGGRRLDTFFPALSKLDAVSFVMIGFMNHTVQKALDRMIDDYGLGDRVYLLPPCKHEELHRFASSADIGLIPLNGTAWNTRYSALNKVSEYLMAGLALLCSNYENLSDIVHNNSYGRVGETYAVSSPDSAYRGLQQLLTNDNYLTCKENAYALAWNVMNWEKEEETLEKIYRNIFKENTTNEPTLPTT